MDLVPVKHKHTLQRLFTVLIAAGTVLAENVPYELRPIGSNRLELTVEKTGLLSGKKHLFTFSRFDGDLTFDRQKPESSVVALRVESNSILCHDTWLSAKDLRRVQDYALEDMLGGARHPQLTFRSTAITKADSSHYKLDGLLTIRDVTKPVVVSVSLNAGPGDALSMEGATVIRLSDFGLKPPKAALGAIGTKNEMSFRFLLTAKRRDAALSRATTE